MGSVKPGPRIGTVHEPGVVAVQVVLQVQLQTLRIEIQLAEVAIAKPVLIERQARGGV